MKPLSCSELQPNEKLLSPSVYEQMLADLEGRGINQNYTDWLFVPWKDISK